MLCMASAHYIITVQLSALFLAPAVHFALASASEPWRLGCGVLRLRRRLLLAEDRTVLVYLVLYFVMQTRRSEGLAHTR